MRAGVVERRLGCMTLVCKAPCSRRGSGQFYGQHWARRGRDCDQALRGTGTLKDDHIQGTVLCIARSVCILDVVRRTEEHERVRLVLYGMNTKCLACANERSRENKHLDLSFPTAVATPAESARKDHGPRLGLFDWEQDRT